MEKLNIAKIETGSMADGPGGPRTVVWLQGCSIRCPGCQNWALWPEWSSDMMKMDPSQAAKTVLEIAQGEPITITGGEPFDQAEPLREFLRTLKGLSILHGESNAPHVIVYTGHEYKKLMGQCWHGREGDSHKSRVILDVLSHIDVLVDGPYDPNLDSRHIQWRGSSNQQPIDLTLTNWPKAGGGYIPKPVTLESVWDAPTVEIIGGKVYATGGLLEDLDLPTWELVPRCGQFEED